MHGSAVSVVSLSFALKDAKEAPAIVEREAARGCDIIILPEMWTGEEPEALEGGSTAMLSSIAKKYGVYVINAIYRKTADRPRVNSSVLIGRDGGIVGIYDKMYPFWPEFDLKPPVAAGTDAPVFDTDFGKVGMAICFDANFPDVWRRLHEGGAQFVFWSSAYSGGRSLMAHALNHNYPIVSATLAGDCVAYDITGEEIYYQKADKGVLVSRIALDTNRAVFHFDFNLEKKERLLREHAAVVAEEAVYNRESWFVLKGTGGASVKELAREYGMEELGAYKLRSRLGIDGIRAGQR